MKRVAVVLGIVLLLPQVARAEFGLGLTVGGVTGDRFYSASSNAPRDWDSPTGAVVPPPFGDELLVDMESWWQLGLTGFTTIHDRFGLRFDLAFADVDVDAKVRDPSGATQTVAWEQMFIFDVIANATYRLGKSNDNYPYLGLGAALTVASGEGNSLDQTMPGLSWVGGWRISAAEGSWMEFFVRGILHWPDWGE